MISALRRRASRRLRRRRRRLRRRRRRFVERRRPLRRTEALVALVEDGVDRAQEDVAQDVEALLAARLDAAVVGAVAEVLEGQLLRIDGEEGVADGDLDRGQRGEVGAGGEDPALESMGLSLRTKGRKGKGQFNDGEHTCCWLLILAPGIAP